MEEIRLAAQTYYQVASEDDRKLADEFFKAMDDNGDGKISCPEFANFMKQEGYDSLNNQAFFREIDEDKDGILNFMEVMTLYYLLKSGRPICAGCRELVTGMYFTCWRCFNNNGSFELHPDCLANKKYVHDHNDAFIDNFALLQVMRPKTPPRDSPPCPPSSLGVVSPSRLHGPKYMRPPCDSPPCPPSSLGVVSPSRLHGPKYMRPPRDSPLIYLASLGNALPSGLQGQNIASWRPPRDSTPSSPSTLAVVPAYGLLGSNSVESSKREKLKKCFKALELACNIGSFGVAATLASGHTCSIL